MKLKNKKTGEIGNLITICASTRVFVDKKSDKVYNTLAELNKDWEDYKDPQEYYIAENGDIKTCGAIEDDIPDEMLSEMKEIGNYFEAKEKAEKALEKLKAWKRLKDKGFRFYGWNIDNGCKDIYIFANYPSVTDDDLKLLFGGEE